MAEEEAMRQNIHIQTIITTTFGLVDEEDNVVELRQVQAQAKKLTVEEMERVLAELLTARKSLRTESRPEKE
jgi:hypothetical protein